MSSSEFPSESGRPLASSPSEAEQIRFYGTPWCGDCRRSMRVFKALGVSYAYIDIERDDQATRLVMELNGGARSVPTIIFPDGSVLTEPANAELEAKLKPFAGA